MKNENFHVITGGPGVGKTTLIAALNSLGFHTIEEDARRIITNQLETDGEGLPWKNKEIYAKLMLHAAMESYDRIVSSPHAGPVFFDRGFIDTLCYMNMEKIQIAEEIKQLTHQYTYNKQVFILPPWDAIYQTDSERKQDWAEAESTFHHMIEAYKTYGYHTVVVPKLSVEERVDYILQNIRA